MYELIRQLTACYGPSGREELVAETIEGLLKDKVDSIRRDAMGNLICERKGRNPQGKRVMLAAHMDQIGFIVVAAEKEGYLRVMNVGGIDASKSALRHVRFMNGVQGVIAQQSLKNDEKPAMKYLYIDVGAKDDAEALQLVQLGDVAVFADDCYRTGEHRVVSPALDDRAACALLVAVMQELPATDDTIIAVFTTQEEVGCRGAKTAAFSVEPDLGLALDVTGTCDAPEEKFPAVKLGEGAAVKVMDRASISNPELVEALLAAAKRGEIAVQREILPYGGTDACAMQTSRAGVPVATVSIPCRYIHSPCEMIDLRDLDACKKLLIEYLK